MNEKGDVCLTCGLPISECICQDKSKMRTINIVHKFRKETGDALDDETEKQIKRLQKERDDAKAQLDMIQFADYTKSVKEFEEEKDNFLDLVKDSDKRQELAEKFDFDEDNPDSFERAKERLSDAKMWSNWIQTGIEQSGGRVTGGSVRRPTGKATIMRNSDDETNFKDYIDELYAIKRNPAKTSEEKQEADRMLDELFMEVIKGVNVAKRRTGRGLGEYQVNQCPRCGKLIQSPRGHVFDECPECGWTLYAKDARRG